MTLESVRSRNDRIRNELRGLIRTFGSLDLRLSGEGLVSFLGASDHAWVGFVHFIFDGDTGCMKPLPGYDHSALDQVFTFLSSLKMVPALGDKENEICVITKDEWKRQLEVFRQRIKESPNLDRYDFCVMKEIADGLEGVVTTICIEPVINQFVSSEYEASKYGELVGTVQQVTAFKITPTGESTSDWNCDIIMQSYDLVEESELHMNHENTFVFRDIIPEEGDYVLRDGATGKYVILPKVNYPGAFH